MQLSSDQLPPFLPRPPRRIFHTNITAPTLLMYGDSDHAILPQMFQARPAGSANIKCLESRWFGFGWAALLVG